MSDILNPSPHSIPDVSEAPAAPEAAPETAAPAEAPAAVAAIQEKADSGEKLTKKEEKKLREYEIKVNGRTEKVKFDPTNDEEVKSWLQKGRASDDKFKEASDVRKAAMSFIEDLKKNPKKVLSDPNIGVDLKKFAEEIMNEAIQEMEKSPEQKEREKLQKELQSLKDERDNEKKSHEAKELARLQAEHERNLESEISTALDVGGLPKTPRTVKHMAEMMMIAMNHGIELTAQEIAPIIKSTTLKEFKEVVNSLADDQLEDFLGKEVIGRLRKRNVAKAKAVETSSAVKSVGSDAKKDEKKDAAPEKKMSIRDFLKA